MDNALDTVARHIARLKELDWNKLPLPPLERARMHLLVAYTVNTLFYVHLKASGADPTDHPVAEELERVKLYMQRLKEATTTTQQQQQQQQSQAMGTIRRALAADCDADEPVARAAAAASCEAASDEFDGGYSAAAAERVRSARAARAEGELRASVASLKKHEGVALGDTDAEAAAALASEVMRRADELGVEGRIIDKPPSKRKTAVGSDSGTLGSDKAKSRKSPKSKKKNAL